MGDGAVLIFLPGIADITSLLRALQMSRHFSQEDRFLLLPLHSSLTSQEQSAVFERCPPGVRKLILATNIAETSIAINDVVYVVDSGRVRELRYVLLPCAVDECGCLN